MSLKFGNTSQEVLNRAVAGKWGSSSHFKPRPEWPQILSVPQILT